MNSRNPAVEGIFAARTEAFQPPTSAIILPPTSKPLYAAYTLLASYWYRRAYASDKPNPYFAARGNFYDVLACEQQPEASDYADYHRMYCMWRDHGFTDAFLHMILHFRGVIFDSAGERGGL
jgi:hypothetical protein